MSFLSSFKKPALLLSLSGALLGMHTSAWAFSDDEARRAILDLRQELRQANEQNQQVRLMLADQIEMLRQEVAELRGEVERLGWQSGRDRQGDTEIAAHVFSDPQEQVSYEAAMDLYRNGQYQEAASALSSFIDAYPDSAYIDEARFYEGSSLFATKKFSAAIQRLQILVKEHPESPRAPDALMVIASSQVEANDLESARTTLEKIANSYPDSSAAETARSRLELFQ